MTDWARGIRSRNYSIRRQPDSGAQREMLLIVLSIVVVATVLLFHSWVRNRIVYVGYVEQQLQADETVALRTGKALDLEEQTLKDLVRIDMIARNELNMSPVRPGQVLPSQYQALQAQDGTVLAMANAPQRSSESRGPSATN